MTHSGAVLRLYLCVVLSASALVGAFFCKKVCSIKTILYVCRINNQTTQL